MLFHNLRYNDSYVEQQSQSPLFQLPAEIRNAIWTYALTAYASCDDRKRRRPAQKSLQDSIQGYFHISCVSSFDAERHKRVSLSLLYSCRRVYLETAFLPPHLNSIVFWCETMPWDQAAVKSNGPWAAFCQNGPSVKPKIHIYTNVPWLLRWRNKMHDSLSHGDPQSLHITLPLKNVIKLPSHLASLSPPIYRFEDFGVFPLERRSTGRYKHLPKAYPYFPECWEFAMKKYTCLQEFTYEIETPFWDETSVQNFVEDAKTWRLKLQTGLTMELGEEGVMLRRMPWPEAFVRECKKRDLGLTRAGLFVSIDKLEESDLQEKGEFTTFPSSC